MRLLVGHCAFGSNDAALLVSLLPELGEQRPSCCAGLPTRGSRRRCAGCTASQPAPVVGELAREAVLSRSNIFDRFRREIGVSPMEHLLGWRMAISEDLICCDSVSVGEVALRRGYSSSSTFSVAFARQVGASPTTYVRGRCAPPSWRGIAGASSTQA